MICIVLGGNMWRVKKNNALQQLDFHLHLNSHGIRRLTVLTAKKTVGVDRKIRMER